MFSRVLWLAAVLLLPAVSLSADEIQLGKNERLSGTILEMSGGKLRFGSQALGEMPIPWVSVTDVRSDQNLAVYAAGKAYVGVLAGIEGAVLKVQTGQGVESIDTRAVDRISTNLPRDGSPKPMVSWRGNLQFGMGYTTGNSQRSEYLVAGELKRKGALSEARLRLSAEQGETNDQRDLARLQGRFGYNRNQAGRTFYSLNVSADHDDVRDLEVRGNYSLSLGYRLIDRSPNRWYLSLGANYVNERYTTRNTDDIALRLESQTDWVVFGRSRLGLNLIAYPTIDEMDHVRASGDLSLSVPISGAVDLTLSVNNEFDSDPPAGVKKNDLRTRTTLGYSF